MSGTETAGPAPLPGQSREQGGRDAASGLRRCSAASVRRGEPLFATAPHVERWLLVEQPGPWGPRSLPQSRLPDGLLLPLRDRARAAGARLALMRTHGRPDGPGRTGGAWEERQVIAVDSRPGHERVLSTPVRTDTDLAGLALPFGPAPTPGWTERPGPLLAVCTHGRHDLCCAVAGRPVAAALARAFPGDVVEVSHLGGHRFAPTVLVLPSGHYLGRLPADDAAAVCRQVLAGERPPSPYYRGRSAFPAHVQAAQHFAVEVLGPLPLSALAPLRVAPAGKGDGWRVELAESTGGAVTVNLHRGAADGQPAFLSCAADEAVPVPTFHLDSLVARTPTI